MKILKINRLLSWISALTLIALVGCNGGASLIIPSNSATNPVTPLTPPTTKGFMSVAVTANPGSATCGYPNAPCVTVTVCDPNESTNCVQIPNVLLDTGSYGLRVFSSFLTSLTLESVTVSGLPIAECVNYADGTANWGPVVWANIQLATGYTAESIPMQLINSSYPGQSGNCSGTSSPDSFQLNGILGVGPLINDNGAYYSCTGGICTELTTPSTNIESNLQVSNPVAFLGESNNGITLKFPSVGPSGGSNVIGYAIFGVNTNSDNTITSESVNIYPSNTNIVLFPIGMNTQYNSTTLSGFLDTGSNAMFFSTSSSTCGTSSGTYYCPSGTFSVTAANQDVSLDYIDTTSNVANVTALFNTGNSAFSNLAGPFIDGYFDYGLPIYLGNTIYTVFNGESAANINTTGPYWAF